jgi:hypoxanthine phosphoribosyltransferase
VENGKVNLDFITISQALKAFPLPEVDHVVGIATGGIVPASLIAHQIDRPLSLIEINYRAQDNSPRHPDPVLLSWQPLLVGGQRILLVDEVAVSGKTMEFAQTFLKDYEVITFVLKGKADYVLFPGIDSCVNWPWKVEVQE